jgi:protein involved in polysaccharide export with SLBB domain
MGSGRGWVSRWPRLLVTVCGVLAGCATDRYQVAENLISYHPPPAHRSEVAGAYQVHCPDVLLLDVAVPHWRGTLKVGPDGRIDLGRPGRVRVDDHTPAEVARIIAAQAGIPPAQVQVQVAEYNSQQLYVFGEVAGLQRAVPYQGPETIVDLLHRIGGVTAGASIGDIRVVRPHIADGKAPEVFRVDLPAIVLKKDLQTNLMLQPHDQIYIGQLRRSCFEACLPPWLRPLFGTLCGIKNQPPAPAASAGLSPSPLLGEGRGGG